MTDQKYDDDEQIIDQDDSGVVGGANDVGKVPLKFDNEPEVPLKDTNYELLLELSGRGACNSRLGADIVMVLDVSGSMAGTKLVEMKRAMQFVIRKLSPSDRLSVVTFASKSYRKCNLRQVTPNAQVEIDFIVQNLAALDDTNITAGLQKALRVLNERQFKTGRSAAIMLMSDGMQNVGDDATHLSVDQFPIFTFGFGSCREYDSRVLNEIARKSNGGTFSLANVGNLSIVFSQCLGGLLSVLVQEVKLVLKPLEDKVSRRERVKSKINKVYAGNYPQSTDDSTGFVTVSFGDLYRNEIRTVLIDLFLPKVSKEVDLDALEIACTYRGETGNLTSTNPSVFRVTRSSNPVIKQTDATIAEIARVEVLEFMKEARVLADENNFEEALNKAVEAQNRLMDVVLQKPNSVIDTLKKEIEEMVHFLQSEEAYKSKGRSFAYCSETCHERQRFASRGSSKDIRPYATPLMTTYYDQAEAFEKDPNKPLPNATDDENQELIANPLAGIAPCLTHYLETAIVALRNIQKLVNQDPKF